MFSQLVIPSHADDVSLCRFPLQPYRRCTILTHKISPDSLNLYVFRFFANVILSVLIQSVT